MDISIIIRTYNEQELLGKTLEMVFKQEINKTYEVIIVDSESTDNTLKIAKTYPVRIVTIKKKDFSYGKSLNLGAKEAKGNIIVNLSAHSPPETTSWLKELTKHFSNKKIVAVYGKQLPLPGCNPLDARELEGFYDNHKRVQTNAYQFSNANCALRKTAQQALPFDEKAVFAEDQIWAKQVVDKNHQIIYEPKAAVYHSHNDGLKKNYQRFKKEAYEINKITPQEFGLAKFIYVTLGGILLDYQYMFTHKTSLKWYVLAPWYRIVRTYGKYKGYRQ